MAPGPPTGEGESPWDSVAMARVLKGFTGMLAAGFDVPRAMGLFLESIGELVRPTRVALLRPDALGREFRIVADRGLPPQLVQGIRLSADDGLIRWLTVQGRPCTAGEMSEFDDPFLVNATLQPVR